jgi:hypothetical protein
MIVTPVPPTLAIGGYPASNDVRLSKAFLRQNTGLICTEIATTSVILCKMCEDVQQFIERGADTKTFTTW